MAYRYRAYHDDPDPLAPPYDVRSALDGLGEAIMSGATPRDALHDLLRQGLPGAPGQPGLDDLLRRVRQRARELRDSTRLDGILEQVRALLDRAVRQERAELRRLHDRLAQATGNMPPEETSPPERTAGAPPAETVNGEPPPAETTTGEPPPAETTAQETTPAEAAAGQPDLGPDSRFRGISQDDLAFREAMLDAVPADTARAIQELSTYDWCSDAARRTFEELRDLLRREVLDSQFRGMRETLANADPAALRQVRQMLSDLANLVDRDARNEPTEQAFAEFIAKHGHLFPEQPRNLDELVDQLARRAAAAQRLLASLTPEQRAELAALIDQTLEQSGLAGQMRQVGRALVARRPDLGWDMPEQVSGTDPIGMSDAVTALHELADLADLETALRQDYPGARLDDIDQETVRRVLGQSAVDDLEALRRVERELEAQGYLRRQRGTLELTPKAVRRLGETALRRVFASLGSGRQGDHDQHDAGTAGEPTGTSRPWQFGDEQPIDVVRTVVNAVRRSAAQSRSQPRSRPRSRAVELSVEDVEVVETEQRTAAAVCLLIDLSYSMALRGTWAAAKRTALALHTLVTTTFPQDAVQIIGFSTLARVLRADELPGLEPDMVQGTNLQHALLIAGRHLDRHPGFEPVVLVITDGEPTAHLTRDGVPRFDWPPSARTLALTLAEVDKMTRRGATINVFLLATDERLRKFVDEVARRNGGRVLSASADRLGEYVVRDYLRAHRRR